VGTFSKFFTTLEIFLHIFKIWDVQKFFKIVGIYKIFRKFSKYFAFSKFSRFLHIFKIDCHIFKII
jgi:hypothetical protein